MFRRAEPRAIVAARVFSGRLVATTTSLRQVMPQLPIVVGNMAKRTVSVLQDHIACKKSSQDTQGAIYEGTIFPTAPAPLFRRHLLCAVTLAIAQPHMRPTGRT